MPYEQAKNEALIGGSELNAGLAVPSPVFTFRGDELIGFIWHIYALARIGDAIKDMPIFTEKEADPMEDEEAQDTLIQGWIDDLQSLPVRADGTVEYLKAPWIVQL